MQTSPKVSVLIPTYNYACFLDKAIESILDQTYTNFELIIVDDLSEDNTDEVVNKYLGDKRISYHQNSYTHGLPGNWNKCLSLANGEYIKFLMADDKLHPQLLEKFVAVLDKYPNVSLVTSHKENFDCDFVNTIQEQHFPSYSNLQNGRKIIYESLNSYNWIGEPTTVMFRKTNLCLGQFNTAYSWIPDWDMWVRQLTVGDCYIIPEVLSYFRQHQNQATIKLSNDFNRQYEEYEFYKSLQIQNPYKLDLQQINFKSILKSKGATYLKSTIKGLTKFGLRKNSARLFYSIKIFFSERLFLKPLMIFLPAKAYNSFGFLKKKILSGMSVILKFSINIILNFGFW
jgi:glycosyltransferase involved in cell wall biosynthesis